MEKIKAAYPRFELEINGSYSHKSPNCAAIKSLWLPEPSFAHQATEGQTGHVTSRNKPK